MVARVSDLQLGHFTLDKVLPVAAGIGGGSADAAAALRLLATLNGLPLDDERLQAVALKTGADVPVCLSSHACDMTGVGETLLPLSPPKMPCVLVNPRIPVATKDVFAALGLRNGELLVGFTDVLRSPAWPEAGASVEDCVEALAASSNDLAGHKSSADHRQGDVQRHRRRLAGALSGSGATCCDLRKHRRSQPRRGDPARAPVWWVHAGVLS
jgi:4-diphosphocytidyl-2-C-methyl-D-erythritol kinase